MEEKQAKLHNLKLTEGEVGTRVGDDEDDMMYSHMDWAHKVQAIAEEIEDDKGMLIPIARANLPLSIRTLLPNNISTWDKFVDGVCSISISRLMDEVDRDKTLQATTTAIASLVISQPSPTPRYNSTLQCTPYRTPYQRSQPVEPQEPPTPKPTAAPNIPPSTPNPRANTPIDSLGGSTLRATTGNPRFPATPASPSANRGSGYVKLAQQAASDNIPYPNTDDGLQKYQTAITAWMLKYGAAAPDWNTDHFPLTPGTSPLGSNECYNCGIAGHRGDECTSNGNPIPKLEATWRSRINGLLRSRRSRFAESSGSVLVFLIDSDRVEVDPGVYDTTELEFTEYEDQGNGQGSRQ
jgi:hypothetical protein